MNLSLRLMNQWRRLLRLAGVRARPLCSTCVYNNPRDCRQRHRPYATQCEDYRRK
jgi:hypothetical protein